MQAERIPHLDAALAGAQLMHGCIVRRPVDAVCPTAPVEPVLGDRGNLMPLALNLRDDLAMSGPEDRRVEALSSGGSTEADEPAWLKARTPLFLPGVAQPPSWRGDGLTEGPRDLWTNGRS